MKKLMAADSIESTEVTPLETEQEVLTISLWFQLEPIAVDTDLVWHNNQCPEPGQSF